MLIEGFIPVAYKLVQLAYLGCNFSITKKFGGYFGPTQNWSQGRPTSLYHHRARVCFRLKVVRT